MENKGEQHNINKNIRGIIYKGDKKIMKLAQILNLNYVIKKIVDDNKITSPLLKFKLLSIMKVFEPSVNNFDIIRNDLILKYGTKNENGNFEIAKNDAEAIKNFNSEIEKIANEDIDIVIPKIKADEVFNAGISADYLLSLYDIIGE